MRFAKLMDAVCDLEDNLTTIEEMNQKGLLSFEKWETDSGKNSYAVVFKGTDIGWRISYLAYKNKNKKGEVINY